MRRSAAILVLSLHACDGKPPTAPCMLLCDAPHWSELDLIAGQPGGPGWVDGVGPAAHFADPWSMALDGSGHLFLLDGETVRTIELASARVTTLAGTFGLAAGDDGVGAAAHFSGPSGIVAEGGTLYVTDTENHTLRAIDVASGTVATIAGTYGSGGTTDGKGTSARFQEPEGLVSDGAGDLYIADTDNNTIRKMVLATSEVTTVVGTPGVAGATDGKGGAVLLDKPKALAWDGAGNLWMIDSENQSVRRVTVADGTVTTLATFDTVPAGIATDGADALVTLGDHRVVRVAGASGQVTTVAGVLDMPGFVDGAGGAARLSRPAGLLADGAGHVYLADGGNYAVRVIALAGATVTTLAGAISIGSSDGVGTQARFWAPAGIAAGAGDVAYVSDGNNHTIRRVALTAQTVTTLAGAAGQMGLTDGTGSAARFYQPAGLALDDAAQILYVSDGGNHAVRRIDLASGAVTTLVPAAPPGADFNRLSAPDGLVLDGNLLYVSDHEAQVVASIDLQTLALTVVAGASGMPGSDDGAGSAARFYSPSGLATDGNGNLYVADVLNNAIRKIALPGGQVSTVAATGFSYPSQVAVDGVGDLFVADALNNRVQHVPLDGGAPTTAIGTQGLSGVRLGSLPSQISQPAALALLPDSRMLLSSENALLMAR